jgi:hypothetical protein
MVVSQVMKKMEFDLGSTTFLCGEFLWNKRLYSLHWKISQPSNCSVSLRIGSPRKFDKHTS